MRDAHEPDLQLSLSPAGDAKGDATLRSGLGADWAARDTILPFAADRLTRPDFTKSSRRGDGDGPGNARPQCSTARGTGPHQAQGRRGPPEPRNLLDPSRTQAPRRGTEAVAPGA